MKYVLIFIASFHWDAGITSQSIEFKSEYACETAKAKLELAFQKPVINQSRKWGLGKFSAVCVKNES